MCLFGCHFDFFFVCVFVSGLCFPLGELLEDRCLLLCFRWLCGAVFGLPGAFNRQNDKLQIASEGFKEIIENIPESEAAFAIAKDGITSRMRTKRVNGAAVLNLYRQCRRLGLSEPVDKAVFAAIQDMTLEDVKAVQKEWVAGRNYVYGILGDPADLNQNFLKTLGPVKTVSLEEIFGY